MNDGLLLAELIVDETYLYAGFDLRWLIPAICLLVAGVYASLCRRVLDVFSRKKLFTEAPKDRHGELARYLDHRDEYLSSLRSLDLLLRLGLVLTLTFGRVLADPRAWFAVGDAADADVVTSPFSTQALAALRLTVEVLVIFVIFLEVLPWILSRVRPESWVLRMLRTIDLVYRVSSPFRRAFQGVVRVGVAVVGGKMDTPSVDALEEEILSVAEEGERDGLLASRDIDMIESIISFGGKTVSEVLTPRTEMVCLDVDDPFEENVKLAAACGHSRIPVYQGSKDNIVGILYVKDLLHDAAVDLPKLVREPHYVSPDENIGELLQKFKTQRFHIAIVRDAQGGTTGLITIEDIVEEIVGDIIDEHDVVAGESLTRVAPNVVEVDAALHVDDLNEQLGIDLPEDDTYETIGGLVFAQMGRIPTVGEVHKLGSSVRLLVTAADKTRIRRLRIELPDVPKAGIEAGE